MMARAAEIVAETGGFPTDQFNNRDALDGYREIGEEIVEQLGDGSVDAFAPTSASAGVSSVRPRRAAALAGDAAGHRGTGGVGSDVG